MAKDQLKTLKVIVWKIGHKRRWSSIVRACVNIQSQYNEIHKFNAF